MEGISAIHRMNVVQPEISRSDVPVHGVPTAFSNCLKVLVRFDNSSITIMLALSAILDRRHMVCAGPTEEPQA